MDQKDIVRDFHSKLTLIEDFHLFKSFVVERTKTPPDQHDKLLELYSRKLSNENFKTLLSEYFTESKTAGFLKNQSTILSTYLVKLNFENIKVLSRGDEQLAQRMVEIKFMQESCIVVAKDLLAGKMDPASALAAKEAEDIRQQLLSSKLEIKDLKERNSVLSTKLNQVSTALQNLVQNIRVKFNLSEKEVYEMTQTPAKEEKQSEKQSRAPGQTLNL